MTVVLTNPVERTRFFRFAMVGLIGFVVDFGVMNLLSTGLHFPLVLAGTISFILAVISNFTFNRHWTYPDSRSRPIIRQLGMFTIVSVVGLAIRAPLLALFERPAENLFASLHVNWPVFSSSFYADNLVLAITVVVVLFWNFFANRHWTYNDVEG